MKRRKINHVFEPRSDGDHHAGSSQRSRRLTPLGISLGAAIASLGMIILSGSAHGQAVNLGTADNFAIITHEGVTNSGYSNVYGDIALYWTPTITGFINAIPSSGVGYVHGTVYYNDGVAGTAWTNADAAYTDLTLRGGATDLSGQDLGTIGSLTAGVYNFTSSAQLTGNLVLDTGSDANAQFIFQIDSTLTTAVGSSITLIGAGAGNTQNIFWQVGSSATLNTGSQFVGNIIARTSISMQEGSNVSLGRLFALDGALTMLTNSTSPEGIVLAGPGSYWNGRESNIWTGENWSDTVAGDTPDGNLAINADVIFSINDNPQEQNTVLGADISISSLTVNDVIPVTIGGPNTLTITGTGGFTGITINSGAGVTTIDSNLVLGVLAQTITVNNADGLVINGVMSGVDGLIKQGTEELTLTGTNTYLGATSVMDGTLQLGDGVTTLSSIALASAITVDALGTLELNLATGETFSNSVVNNGLIQWIASGTNTQGATSVFSGLGDMLITGTGTTVLLGDNSLMTGGTTVDTSGFVNVGHSSAFGLGTLTINNGTIDTVNSEPLQINVGDYVQTGGELRIRLSGPGGAVNTQYSVTGTADINGGTVFLYDGIDVYDLDGYTPTAGDSQTIIDSTVPVTGTGFVDNTPDSLIQGINYSFGNTLLYPTLNYDVLNSVYVLWVQDSFASLPGATANQTSLGNALDAGAAPVAVTDFLNTQNVALLPGLFDLISPDELTSMYQMGFAGSDLQNANIQRHLERVRNGAPRQTQYTETVTDSKGGMVQQQATRMSDANRWSVFLEGHDGSGSVDGDLNASGYDFDMRGATLGADLRVSDNLVVGILGAYTESDAMLVNGGLIEDEAFKGAIYATYYKDAFYVDALLGVGSHSYDITRIGLAGTALGETDGWEIDALLNTGYDIKNGNWTYGPTASIAYTRIELDEFSETGSFAPLSFPEQHQDSLRSQLGAKLAYTAEFGSMTITPQVRVAWQHEFMDSTQSIDSSFVGGSGGSFSTNGPSMDEDRFVLGAGLTVQVTPNFSIYGSYDGNIGSSDYDSQQVTAGIKFDF